MSLYSMTRRVIQNLCQLIWREKDISFAASIHVLMYFAVA